MITELMILHVMAMLKSNEEYDNFISFDQQAMCIWLLCKLCKFKSGMNKKQFFLEI